MSPSTDKTTGPSDKTRPVAHIYSGASRMYAEPREWFPERADLLLFSNRALETVLHLRSGSCTFEFPHRTEDCGHWRRR